MRVLDLFSGLGGFSQSFAERGHEVTTVDFIGAFKPSITADVMNLSPDDFLYYDVILASPPCNCFSVGSISTHWTGGKTPYRTKDNKVKWLGGDTPYTPRTRAAEYSIKLVRHTLSLIKDMKPAFWYLENPRGVLRKIIGLPTRTIWLCQFGDERAKPTDLWGNHAPTNWPPMCKNGNPDCSHQRAPRSSATGTQGRKTPELRSFLPKELSDLLCKACEWGIKQ